MSTRRELSEERKSGAARISDRKGEHIRICLEEPVEFKKKNGFEKFEFMHVALPELCLSEIDTTTTFLGRKFSYPFFIEALTGGAPGTGRINRNLARACEAMGIGMGVGSQRAMLHEPSLVYTYRVRDVAPNIFLLGNIGAAQLAGLGPGDLAALVCEIAADGLAVHLNAAQEMVQREGDTDWRHIQAHIKRICGETTCPVIVKETGCGITGDIAGRLVSAGAAALDIGGAGGTSFARVEHFRGSGMARAFFEWGIPTAESLRQCRAAVNIPLIASGGMRTGVECAKALSLGATLVGFGLPMLRPAQISWRGVAERIMALGVELKKAMLLIGAKTIGELKNNRLYKI